PDCTPHRAIDLVRARHDRLIRTGEALLERRNLIEALHFAYHLDLVLSYQEVGPRRHTKIGLVLVGVAVFSQVTLKPTLSFVFAVLGSHPTRGYPVGTPRSPSSAGPRPTCRRAHLGDRPG